MIIRILNESDERSDFACGDPDFDDFLRRYAAQNQFVHHISTTMVVVEDEQVIGYATFSLGELSRDDLPPGEAEGLPRYPLPALRLGRLAVDERFQGVGLGSALIREVVKTALRLREQLGCVAVLVDALPDKADFYVQLGFKGVSLRLGRSRIPGTVPMLLPLRDAAEAASR